MANLVNSYTFLVSTYETEKLWMLPVLKSLKFTYFYATLYSFPLSRVVNVKVKLWVGATLNLFVIFIKNIVPTEGDEE